MYCCFGSRSSHNADNDGNDDDDDDPINCNKTSSVNGSNANDGHVNSNDRNNGVSFGVWVNKHVDGRVATG